MAKPLSSATARKLEELTRKSFQAEYPTLHRFFGQLADMSRAELEERDQLMTHWSKVRVTAHVQQYVATLAILKSQPATSATASRICIPFNLFDGGCTKDRCRYRHLCLFCGQDSEDRHARCPARDSFHAERKALRSRLHHDPLDPTAPGICGDDENLLASLKRLARDPLAKTVQHQKQEADPETPSPALPAALGSLVALGPAEEAGSSFAVPHFQNGLRLDLSSFSESFSHCACSSPVLAFKRLYRRWQGVV